jgi:hypothetical protein
MFGVTLGALTLPGASFAKTALSDDIIRQEIIRQVHHGLLRGRTSLRLSLQRRS